MDMFRPNIALAIESGGSPPTMVAKCVERAIRIEYRLVELKEERARNFEARRNQWREGSDSQAKGSNRGSKPNYKPNQTTNFKKKRKPSGQGSQSNQPRKKKLPKLPTLQEVR